MEQISKNTDQRVKERRAARLAHRSKVEELKMFLEAHKARRKLHENIVDTTAPAQLNMSETKTFNVKSTTSLAPLNKSVY